MANEIKIPKPTESPLVRTTEPREPRTVLRTNTDEPKSTVKGRVYMKEPSFKEKLKRSFVKEDIKSVRDYIIFDVLVPNIKRSVFDMITGAVGQTLGIQIPRSLSSISPFRNENRVTSGYRDYTAVSSRTRQLDPIGERYSASYDRFKIRDLAFESKQEALDVLEYLIDVCDQKSRVSVFTYYERASITNGNHYTNHKWGWYNLDGVDVLPVEVPEFESGIGYILTLPDAKPF